jgi:hypothetical protein
MEDDEARRIHRLLAARRIIEAWLRNSGTGAGSADGHAPDGEILFQLNTLALRHGPRAELAGAVHQARDEGWGWSPVAIALGMSLREAIARFG